MEQTNRFRGILVIAIVIIFIAQVFFFWSMMNSSASSENEKIGYVNTHELVYKYKGYLDAQNDFAEEEALINKSVDSLKYVYQMSVNDYKASIAQLTDQEKLAREQMLQFQYQNMMTKAKEAEEKIAELENQMLNGVLNQVNAMAIDFSSENEIKILLGTTSDGSIMYGNEALNYTDEMLTYINSRYDGN